LTKTSRTNLTVAEFANQIFAMVDHPCFPMSEEDIRSFEDKLKDFITVERQAEYPYDEPIQSVRWTLPPGVWNETHKETLETILQDQACETSHQGTRPVINPITRIARRELYHTALLLDAVTDAHAVLTLDLGQAKCYLWNHMTGTTGNPSEKEPIDMSHAEFMSAHMRQEPPADDDWKGLLEESVFDCYADIVRNKEKAQNSKPEASTLGMRETVDTTTEQLIV
jgi:hypothetical protein